MFIFNTYEPELNKFNFNKISPPTTKLIKICWEASATKCRWGNRWIRDGATGGLEMGQQVD
jgi:hypothetical protein